MDTSALVSGTKGLKYFAYDFREGAMQGMVRSPALVEAAAEIGVAVRAREDLLAPLIPVSRERLTDPDDIEVQTSWAGDAGAVLLVRNLRCRSVAESADGGPCFIVEERRNLALCVAVPPWLRVRGVRDFLSGAELPSRQLDAADGILPGQRAIEVTLDRLGAFRLLWIEDRRAPKLAPLQARRERLR